jgi:hypothetical protein
MRITVLPSHFKPSDEFRRADYIAEHKEGKGTVYISTPRGRALYKCAPVQLRKPDLTAYFEELLARVSEGTLSAEAFMARQAQFVRRLIEAVKSGEAIKDMPGDIPCAPGKPNPLPVKGRSSKGSATRLTSKSKANGKTIVGKCARCGEPMVERNGTRGKFLGCSKYPACGGSSGRGQE